MTNQELETYTHGQAANSVFLWPILHHALPTAVIAGFICLLLEVACIVHIEKAVEITTNNIIKEQKHLYYTFYYTLWNIVVAYLRNNMYWWQRS